MPIHVDVFNRLVKRHAILRQIRQQENFIKRFQDKKAGDKVDYYQKLEAENLDKTFHRHEASLDALKAELKAADDAFKALYWSENLPPFEKLWPLCVDGNVIPEGRRFYDQGSKKGHRPEPGYIDAAETGLMFALATREAPLTPVYLQQLHGLILCNVVRNQPPGKDAEYLSHVELSSFPPDGGSCAFQADDVTFEGLDEMSHWADSCSVSMLRNGKVDFLSKDTVQLYYDTIKNPVEHPEVDFHKNWKTDTVTELNRMFREYEIAKSLSREEVDPEFAVAYLLRRIDTYHPFRDGNIRLCRALMYRELINLNCPLTIIPDPNILDGHSSDQFVEVMKAGRAEYTRLYQTSNAKPSVTGMFHAHEDKAPDTIKSPNEQPRSPKQ